MVCGPEGSSRESSVHVCMPVGGCICIRCQYVCVCSVIHMCQCVVVCVKLLT